ncbi:hypothetical protein [Streptosporangium sp. NPDC051022]|uniref:hypothetical protein n=1 Tax=Streptosporangium sp. NPDC051022 TaxID=3155752 RepID=UPI0034472E4B
MSTRTHPPWSRPHVQIAGTAVTGLALHAHLPHYGHAAAPIGLLVFLAVLVVLMIAFFRPRKK